MGLITEHAQDWGNRLLEDTKKTCAHQDSGKEQGLHKTEPDLPVHVPEPLVEAWVDSGLLWSQGH